MSGAEIVVLNPRRRRVRRKRRASGRRRKGRMPAALRRYWASRRAGKASGTKRRRRRSRAVIAAPRRRRRVFRGGFRMRRRRRNPRFSLAGFSSRSIMAAAVPAAIGAGGALLLDVGMAYAPLPESLRSGWLNTLAKVAGAVVIGFGVGAVAGRKNGAIATGGALTVIAYNALRDVARGAVGDKVKGLSGLADFTDYTAGELGAYQNGGMPQLGAYQPGSFPQPEGLGYTSPAAFVPDDGASMGYYPDGM